MQVNIFAVINEVETAHATPDSGYTLAVEKVNKNLKLCDFTLIFSGVTMSATSSWNKVASVPYKPLHDVFGNATNGNNAMYFGQYRIDTSGNVYLSPASSVSNIYVSLCGTYITND